MSEQEYKHVYRVIIFIPTEDRAAFVHKISPYIPVFGGPYDHVIWWSDEGVEQFRPLEGANPADGEIGKITQKPSSKVEIALDMPRDQLIEFIDQRILPAHPWEKPAFYFFKTEMPV